MYGRRVSQAETGFTFKRGEGGLPQFRSPFSPSAQDYINLDDADSTKGLWGGTRQTVIGIFKAGLKEKTTPEALPAIIAALPPATIEGLATQAFSTLPPQALQGLPPELAPLLQPGAIAAMPPEQLQQIVPLVLQALPPEVVQGLAASTWKNLSNGLASIIPEEVDGINNVLRILNPETRNLRRLRA